MNISTSALQFSGAYKMTVQVQDKDGALNPVSTLHNIGLMDRANDYAARVMARAVPGMINGTPETNYKHFWQGASLQSPDACLVLTNDAKGNHLTEVNPYVTPETVASQPTRDKLEAEAAQNPVTVVVEATGTPGNPFKVLGVTFGKPDTDTVALAE